MGEFVVSRSAFLKLSIACQDRFVAPRLGQVEDDPPAVRRPEAETNRGQARRSKRVSVKVRETSDPDVFILNANADRYPRTIGGEARRCS